MSLRCLSTIFSIFILIGSTTAFSYEVLLEFMEVPRDDARLEKQLNLLSERPLEKILPLEIVEKYSDPFIDIYRIRALQAHGERHDLEYLYVVFLRNFEGVEVDRIKFLAGPVASNYDVLDPLGSVMHFCNVPGKDCVKLIIGQFGLVLQDGR